MCAGYGGETTVKAKTYSCYKKDAEGNKVKVGGYATFNGASATCTTSWEVDKYECKYPNPATYECDVQYLKETIEHPAVYRTTGTYTVTSKKTIQTEIPCSNPCQYLGQKNCNSGKCYETKEITETIEKPCGTGISACLETPGAPTEYIYDTKKGTCYYPCTTEKVGTETKSKTWTETAPALSSTGETTGDGIECEEDPEGSGGTAYMTYYTVEEDGCAVSTSTNTVSYSKETHSSSYSVGRSPFCTTASFAGGLGFSFNTNNFLPGNYAEDGPHVNSGLSASSPHSFCGDLGDCGPSVGLDYRNTYTEATINEHTIKSYSATAGARFLISYFPNDKRL